MTNLSSEALSEGLLRIPEWSGDQACIHREYRFTDFASALGFMVNCGVQAEKQNHHPEWSNVYNKVNVTLTTHDEGGVTDQDLELARLMDTVYRTNTRE
jgi:4a-hydroxytetrahydrobiopterin dehydratase